MAAGAAFHPTAARGLYPERRDVRDGVLEEGLARLRGRLARIERVRGRELARWLAEVERETPAGLSDAALLQRGSELALELRRHGFVRPLAARAFALVREAAGRHLGLRHHDAQLAGGWQLLRGRLIEMETGEGKTLTAILPACTAALTGIPVHVVSVNDYLTRRDAEQMRPVYEAFGLRVGVVQEGMGVEERQAAYAADVTYATNKQLAFDFLRDRRVLGERRGELRVRLAGLTGDGGSGRLLLRGLGYGIVDEADSVLIDEARTPLILSAPQDDSEQEALYQQALALSRALDEGRDFALVRSDGRIELSASGRRRLAERAEELGGLWGGRRRREELVTQALLARLVFQRDEHYLVRDGRIRVIDEYTGRVMEDRAWGRGIQQLIEAKEGCPLTGVREPLARISYQRFFRRYLHLAGMTGTAAEVAGELASTYGLRCARIPTHRPLRRLDLGARVLPSAEARWQAVADRVETLHRERRAVLVGTRSVAASEELAERLTARGLEIQVLTARQDGDEAAVVARAGQPGRVTVATNMAGRGTDIPLDDEVRERWGLAVILTERHDAGRIDRQLAGRCARQGDPGSFEAILSLEDPLARSFGRRPLLALARIAGAGPVGGWLSRHVIRAAQGRAERMHRRVRLQLLRGERQQGDTLAFAGPSE